MEKREKTKERARTGTSKKGCIICGKEKDGFDVKEDYVIESMRWFKRNVTRNAKNYTIVVCKECVPQYRKLRARHVRSRSIYVGLGVIFTVTLLLASHGSLGALAYGIAMTVFLYLLSLLSYIPAVKDESKLNAFAVAAAEKKPA
jgi:hypothetical protein